MGSSRACRSRRKSGYHVQVLMSVLIWDQSLNATPETSKLPSIPSLEIGVYHHAQLATEFLSTPLTPEEVSWSGVDVNAALTLLATSPNVQDATGLDSTGLRKRLSHKWTATEALQDCASRIIRHVDLQLTVYHSIQTIQVLRQYHSWRWCLPTSQDISGSHAHREHVSTESRPLYPSCWRYRFEGRFGRKE